MTPNEERLYLCNLLLEASRWRISEEDEGVYNGLELEVRERLQRLNADTSVEQSVEVSGEPAKPARRMNAAQRYRATHVRVKENGKPTWRRKDECRQVPVDGNPGKFRWVWDGPKEPVDKLGDELWAERDAEK